MAHVQPKIPTTISRSETWFSALSCPALPQFMRFQLLTWHVSAALRTHGLNVPACSHGRRNATRATTVAPVSPLHIHMSQPSESVEPLATNRNSAPLFWCKRQPSSKLHCENSIITQFVGFISVYPTVWHMHDSRVSSETACAESSRDFMTVCSVHHCLVST